VLRVHPVGGRDLAAAGQGGQEAVGDVTLRQAQLGDAGAVDVDAQFRPAFRLLHAHVGQPADAADLFEQNVGVGAVGGGVGARDLQVDGRGRAEVQDLADDVGRQEGEG